MRLDPKDLDYRKLTGCLHARHESCPACVCPECGSPSVQMVSVQSGTHMRLSLASVWESLNTEQQFTLIYGDLPRTGPNGHYRRLPTCAHDATDGCQSCFVGPAPKALATAPHSGE